jgi:hypothetical protein
VREGSGIGFNDQDSAYVWAFSPLIVAVLKL